MLPLYLNSLERNSTKINVTICNQKRQKKEVLQPLITKRVEAPLTNAADRNRTVLTNLKYW